MESIDFVSCCQVVYLINYSWLKSINRREIQRGGLSLRFPLPCPNHSDGKERTFYQVSSRKHDCCERVCCSTTFWFQRALALSVAKCRGRAALLPGHSRPSLLSSAKKYPREKRFTTRCYLKKNYLIHTEFTGKDS